MATRLEEKEERGPMTDNGQVVWHLAIGGTVAFCGLAVTDGHLIHPHYSFRTCDVGNWCPVCLENRDSQIAQGILTQHGLPARPSSPWTETPTGWVTNASTLMAHPSTVFVLGAHGAPLGYAVPLPGAGRNVAMVNQFVRHHSEKTGKVVYSEYMYHGVSYIIFNE